MRVFVYYNLHKHCWSVKALEGPNKGRVIAHRDVVALTGVTFKVSEAGRQRVLRERRKNVHAGVVGHWDESNDPTRNIPSVFTSVTYNPYKYSTFVKKVDETPIHSADVAVMSHRMVYVQ